MSHSGPITDCKEIAQRIKGQKPPFQCPACNKEYKSLAGILYHIGQFGPSTSVPRCLANGEETPQSSPPSHSSLRPRRSATPPTTPSTTLNTRAVTPAATMASVMAASHPCSPVSSVGGVTASGRRRPRRELTWGETQRLVEVEFDNNYRRVEIDYDLEISDEERQPVAEVTASAGRRGTPQKRGRGSVAPNETPNRGAVAIGKPANLSTVKDKCKRRSKPKAKNDMVVLPKAEITIVDVDFSDAPTRGSSYYRFVEQSAEDLDENVEYDMDEEDYQWLSLMNEERKGQGLTSVPQDVFEILMDRLEKECIFESQTFVDGDDGKNMYNIDENAVCCICNDGECHNTNAILFCDMCNLAVHQECYGVPYIPEGQWLCRRCIESPSRGVDCALCPNKGGAFKRTLDARWAHVICAIWIPEVQFANPVFLEPIDGIKEIPSARWRLTCYICRRRMGACIQCSKSNCCTAFHVTCAQQAQLYMKIEPAKGGTVKKTAYCDAHTPPSVKRKLEKAAKELEMKESKGGDGAGENSESGKNGSAKKGKMEREEKKGEDEEEVVDVVDGKDAASSSTDGSKKGKDDNQQDNSDSDSKPHRVLSSNVLRARKMMEERRGQSNVPVVNIPFVPQNRLDHIISQVSVMKKSQFIPKLVNYWKLKRQSRNGVPLLRRLQANKGQRATAANLTDEERSVLVDQLALWNSLRHDLERARMLVELVRKREKLKREQLRLLMTISELQLRPLNFILKKALDRIARKDPAKIFTDPVSIEDVPDYLDIIRKPMDFSTMRSKLESNGYTCLEDFEKDFKLVWHNATIYNQKDTIYYKAAIRIKEAGQKVLEQAKLQVATAGIHCKTGLHYPDVEDSQPCHSYSSSSTVNGSPSSHLTPPIDVLEMNDESMLDSFRERRYSTTSQVSLEEQMDFLQEKLQMLQGHTGSQCRRKEKALRKELSMLRRQQKHESKTSADTEDHSSVSSPRRHRAPSIPRNAEELASHLIHGSLRFTPSRQQILSHSGIRLEERASALKKEEEEAAAAREQQQATPTPGKERGRLHSNSDSMLLVRANRHSSDSLTRMERRKPRGRSSEPSFVRGDSDGGAFKTAASSASETEEVIRPRKRKRNKKVDDDDDEGGRAGHEEEEEEDVVRGNGESKRKRVKKRRRERLKENEGDKPHANDTSLKVASSSKSKESQGYLSQATPRPKRPSSAASKSDVTGKRRRKIRRNEDYEEDYDEDDDYDGQGMDDEQDLSFSVGRPKSRNKKIPAAFLPNPKVEATPTPKQSLRQARMRIKSSDTVTTESEVEGSRSEVTGQWLNGNVEGRNKPRKSGRLSAALRSSSIEESDTIATARRKRQERCRRSQSSSVYETAGEADISEFESKRAERQKRKRKKPNSYFSDSENRDVFSEGVATPPSATSTKDLTLHINESASINSSGRRSLDQRRGGNKRKRSGGNSDKDGGPSDKKSRMGSESVEGVQHEVKSGMVNGLVMNGERATMADEIRPMELVWAKCRGYPPYPALVINPDIPENGIIVRGEKILPPSDEVMDLKEKNPTSTYLVRFFDGRRTWQCLPPEKIEPLGLSVESDNAKIAMAGSSKRSVKEAFTRAKQWLQRKDNKSTSKSSSHDSEPRHNSVDSDGEDYREV